MKPSGLARRFRVADNLMREALRRASLTTVSLVALSFGLVLAAGVASAAQNIVVAPGIGAGDRPPPAQQPAPRILAPAPPVTGAYGGGFLEFLITGASEGPRPHPSLAAPHAAPVLGPPPAPAYSNAYVAALPGPAPALEDEPHPADGEFRRQEVAYDGAERPGTIIIDTPRKLLFLIQPGGRALRYGIGVGRPGFEWSGVKTITRKAEWPGWTPPAQMMLRRPDLPAHMDGGIGNPLGARALYLGSSLYRIHGTNEPSTIGQNVSSGCIRMMNQDVIDLYNRVPVGTKVIVI
jgi:lipoprotein-anchoring transpeptidase ErfK/SrfK